MRIPKGLDKALNNRKRNAEMINQRNTFVERWLRDNKIIVSDEDLSGVQVLSDPQGSIDRIRAAILAKPVKKKIESIGMLYDVFQEIVEEYKNYY